MSCTIQDIRLESFSTHQQKALYPQEIKNFATSIFTTLDHITYVFGTFLIVLCLRNMITKVPLPNTPMTNMRKNSTGTKYVSGRSPYGI